jgi:hypothetical protein
MTVTRLIRQQINPFQRDDFRKYAENWGRITPGSAANSSDIFCPMKPRTMGPGD